MKKFDLLLQILLISNIKAVDEPWKKTPPWKRYQKKLIEDLAVLGQEKEMAIDLPQFEKLTGTDRLYSIRHPESRKNVRVIYTIYDSSIILLTAFLEKNDGDYPRAIKTANIFNNGKIVIPFVNVIEYYRSLSE